MVLMGGLVLCVGLVLVMIRSCFAFCLVPTLLARGARTKHVFCVLAHFVNIDPARSKISCPFGNKSCGFVLLLVSSVESVDFAWSFCFFFFIREVAMLTC